jgi:hypothetical protein
MAHIFNIPIGDWSGDGHSECVYFTIETNVSLETFREMYFQTKENTELSPEDICKEYQDSSLSEEQIKDLGLNVSDYEQWIKDQSPPDLADSFFSLFIDYMKTHNSTLDIKVIQDPKLQMFPFYGFDDNKRHIGFLGYGIYD